MNKLSPGTLLLGIFAVLFGLVGAYAVKQHLKREEPKPAETATVSKLTVPLASADLAPGRTITTGDVMLVKMTHQEIKKRKIPREFMTNSNQVIGRTLREPVSRGKAFVTTAFYPEGVGPSVASRLKPGYRAVTVPLEDNTAASGLVSPGAIVDVIFRTHADPKRQVPETTVTLLESVEVLAIGQETFLGARATGKQQGKQSATVSLAVTPEQGAALKVTEGHGTMSLALRSPSDDAVVDVATPATLTGVLGLAEPEKPFSTQIYRRGHLSTTTFESGHRGDTLYELPMPAITESKPAPVRAAAQQATDERPTPIRAKATSTTRVRQVPTLAAHASPGRSKPCCGEK